MRTGRGRGRPWPHQRISPACDPASSLLGRLCASFPWGSGGAVIGLVPWEEGPRRKGRCLAHSGLCLHQGHSNGNRRYESDEDSLGSSGRVMLPEEPLS